MISSSVISSLLATKRQPELRRIACLALAGRGAQAALAVRLVKEEGDRMAEPNDPKEATPAAGSPAAEKSEQPAKPASQGKVPIQTAPSDQRSTQPDRSPQQT